MRRSGFRVKSERRPMCNVCMYTQTFVPDRHKSGEPVYEGIAQTFVNAVANSGPMTVTETTDAPAGTTTPYSIEVGDTFAGTFSNGQDTDWVALTVQAGTAYSVFADLTSNFSRFDGFMSVFDSSGDFVATNLQDNNSSRTEDVTFFAEESGTYYVSLRLSDAVSSTT